MITLLKRIATRTGKHSFLCVVCSDTQRAAKSVAPMLLALYRMQFRVIFGCALFRLRRILHSIQNRCFSGQRLDQEALAASQSSFTDSAGSGANNWAITPQTERVGAARQAGPTVRFKLSETFPIRCQPYASLILSAEKDKR